MSLDNDYKPDGGLFSDEEEDLFAPKQTSGPYAVISDDEIDK